MRAPPVVTSSTAGTKVQCQQATGNITQTIKPASARPPCHTPSMPTVAHVFLREAKAPRAQSVCSSFSVTKEHLSGHVEFRVGHHMLWSSIFCACRRRAALLTASIAAQHAFPSKAGLCGRVADVAEIPDCCHVVTFRLAQAVTCHDTEIHQLAAGRKRRPINMSSRVSTHGAGDRVHGSTGCMAVGAMRLMILWIYRCCPTATLRREFSLCDIRHFACARIRMWGCGT